MFFVTISSLIAILKSCFIMFGYIQSSQLFPEPLTPDEEKYYLEKLNNRRRRCKKYSYREESKISCTYFKEIF